MTERVYSKTFVDTMLAQNTSLRAQVEELELTKSTMSALNKSLLAQVEKLTRFRERLNSSFLEMRKEVERELTELAPGVVHDVNSIAVMRILLSDSSQLEKATLLGDLRASVVDVVDCCAEGVENCTDYFNNMAKTEDFHIRFQSVSKDDIARRSTGVKPTGIAIMVLVNDTVRWSFAMVQDKVTYEHLLKLYSTVHIILLRPSGASNTPAAGVTTVNLTLSDGSTRNISVSLQLTFIKRKIYRDGTYNRAQFKELQKILSGSP